MSKCPELTPAELRVMKALCEVGPASVADVRGELTARGHELAYTTVMTLLGRLASKGAVVVDRAREPFVYKPAHRRESVLRERLRAFVRDVFDGQADSLVLRLVEDEALTRDELRPFHDERFAPSALTAVVVGDVEPARVLEAAADRLGSWRRPPPARLVVPAAGLADRRQRLVIPMMNKSQADIAYGLVTIARSDPEYYAVWLMNNILGQYAMGGRLGESIRERQGMAYYATSSLDANVAPGPLVVRAGVAGDNVDRAVASIDAEISAIVRDGATAKEFADSRTFLVGAIPRALETNAAIANFLQTEELFGLGVDYDARLPELLGAVTLDAVNAAAQRVLDAGRATVVVAGPYR